MVWGELLGEILYLSQRLSPMRSPSTGINKKLHTKGHAICGILVRPAYLTLYHDEGRSSDQVGTHESWAVVNG